MEVSAAPSPGRPLARALAYLVIVLLVSLLLGVLWGEGLGLEAPGGGTSTLMDLLFAGLLIVPVELAVTHLFLRRWDHCGWRELLSGPLPPRAPRPDAVRAESGMDAQPAGGPAGRGRRGSSLAQFALGCALGAGFRGLLLVAGTVAGWVRWTGWGPAAAGGWAPAVQATAIALAAAFLQGGGEEVIFRGYVLRNLAQWRGLAAAAAGSGLLFGLVHGLNPGAGPLAFLGITVIGVFLALLRARSSVWAAAGLHGVWNGALVLLSLPCSGMVFEGLASVQVRGPRAWTGGEFGIEASLLTTVAFGLGALVLTARRGVGRPNPADALAPCDSGPAPPRST